MNEVIFAIALVAMAGAGAVGSWLSFMTGYKSGFLTSAEIKADPIKAMTNEVYKGRSRGGAVPEFMAPGEHAEVVELCGMGDRINDFEKDCFGCRYAGRYLWPVP